MAEHSRYFKLQEFLTSSTARQRSIENMPGWAEIDNLRELALFLDGVRASYGKPITVNSGFRCEKLNSAIKGASKTSVHMKGLAADLSVSGGKKAMDDFGKFLVDYLKDKKFDQLLIEKSSNGGYWFHLGLRGNNGEQRQQIKNMNV